MHRVREKSAKWKWKIEKNAKADEKGQTTATTMTQKRVSKRRRGVKSETKIMLTEQID